VLARWLQNRHIHGRTAPLQLGRNVDASGTAANDQDLVVGHGWGETRQLKRLFQI